MSASTFLLAFVSVLLNAFAQICLRQTMLRLPSLPEAPQEVAAFSGQLLAGLWFPAGLFCYAVSIVLWMLVLGRTEVSLAYPLLSMGYVIVAVIGYLLLGENVNTLRVVGIAVICAGIVLVSRSA